MNLFKKKEAGRKVRIKAEEGEGGAVPHEERERMCYENLQSQAEAKGKE